MITVERKPFRIKSLGQSRPAVTSTIPEPNPDRASTETELESDLIKTECNPYSLTKFEGSKIILSMVSNNPNLSSSELNQLLIRDIKKNKYNSVPDVSTTGYITSILKNLVNQKKLTRIKVNNVYLYYRRVD